LQRSNWIPASCLLLRHATIRSRMVAWNKHLHAGTDWTTASNPTS
jgi:hypothetical protein